MMSLLVVGILILINFILAAASTLAAKPHNQVVLENTLPKDKLDQPETLALRKLYKKRQFQLAIIFSLLDCVLLLPMKDSLFMLLFFFLLFLTIGIGYSLQIRYIRKMHHLIVTKHWQLAPQPIRVDTKLILTKNQRLLSGKWFILSFLLLLGLNLLLALKGEPTLTLIMSIASWFTWGLSLLGWYFVARLSVRSLTDEQTINRQYNDLTKFYWSILMVGMSLLIPVVLFLPFISMYSTPHLFILITMIEFVLLLLLCIGSVYLLFSLRKKQDQLLNQTVSYRYYGDDEYWRYGIYYNPNDSRLMVPDRIGMNMSLNLGKKTGKIFLAALGAIILAAMFISLTPLYVLDYHPDPLTYQVTSDNVILDGPMTKKSLIPVKQIQQVVLTDEAPSATIKENGLATTHYALGHFRVQGKSSMLYLIKGSQPILQLKTKQQIYYYTNKDAKQTRLAYQKIIQAKERAK